MDRVFVQHPISDQTTEQLYSKADAAMAVIIEGLQSNAPVAAVNTPMHATAAPEEECSA